MKITRKSRRGSTLVMVAILLVAFVGVGAIGADIGRFYVVAGELQTAADAAALAGALELSRTSGLAPGMIVKDSVQAFVSKTNRSDGDSLTVSFDDIKMMFYTPPDTATQTPADFSYNVASRRPNAVEVTLRGDPRGIFSQMIGRTAGLNLDRKAVAWVANVNSNCVRGMALPYRSLYNQVSAIDVTAPATVPNLDPVEFIAYEKLAPASRMFILAGPNVGQGPKPPLTTQQALYSDGTWRGVEYHGNNGKNAFMANIAGCTRTGLSAANVKALSSVQVEDWTDEGLTTVISPNTRPVCYTKSNDAGCYDSPTAANPGVVINVDWTDDPDAQGSFGPKFRYVGKFTLLCYNFPASEPCNVTKAGAPTIYPEGTIVGYMHSLSSTKITPDDLLTNMSSNVQVLILVK
jgi:Flp pilus assembly protein TadG